MFLLVVILFIAIAGLYHLINDWRKENKRRDRAIKEGRDSYTDRYGRSCEVDTGVPFRYERMPTGKKGVYDTVKVNAHNGQIMRNYSQEIRDQMAVERAERKTAAIAAGERFYVCEYPRKRGGAELYKTFDGFRSDELPEAPAMFEDISTGKRYLAGAIHTSMYDHTKKKPKKIVGGVIGIGMWNVDTRKFEMFYDEELMTASNLDECRRRVENYGNLRGRPIGLDRIYNITWLDTLKHGSFSESFHKKR